MYRGCSNFQAFFAFSCTSPICFLLCLFCYIVVFLWWKINDYDYEVKCVQSGLHHYYWINSTDKAFDYGARGCGFEPWRWLVRSRGKIELAWNSPGQGTYCQLSRCNPYETRGADPGCDGSMWIARVCALEAAKSLNCWLNGLWNDVRP